MESKGHSDMHIDRTIKLLAAISIVLISSAQANPKIDDYAVTPVTKAGFPKLYKEWGAKGFKKINSLMPLAAEKAATSSECDKVTMVDISAQRSKAPSKIVFFADCENGKRFYIEDNDLTSNSAIESQEAKIAKITDMAAIDGCDSAIKAQLNNPLTFDRKILSTQVIRGKQVGNVIVRFEFEAKNDLGASLPHKAECVINDKGMKSAQISK